MLIKDKPARPTEVIIAVIIVVISLIIAWNIQDSNQPHPEVQPYNSNIP